MELYDVWIEKINKAEYPEVPFHPAEIYPELNDLGYSVEINRENQVYGAVRQILYQLGFDKENYGTKRWNPMKGFVNKGDAVIVKPNFVRGTHIWGERGVRAMVTNMAVVRPIVDYILLATGGEVKIIIGDAPIRTSDWNDILESSRVDDLVKFYTERNYNVQLIDFRKDWVINNKEQVYEKVMPNPYRKAEDYMEVDVEKESMLCEIIDSRDNFEMGGVKFGTIKKYHNEEKNTYLIPKEVLESDVFINIPKLKTHRMAGLTCAMKNLIGINGEKERIAHYRRGVKDNGSDEYERFNLIVYLRERIWAKLKFSEKPWTKRVMALGKRFVQKYIWKGKTFEETYALNPPKYYREGGWRGNDTLWRCAIDINHILLYADKSGKLQKNIQRKYLCMVDAVITGEGEGPLAGTPKETGIVFGGLNPVAVDYAAASIMNFDYSMMPMINRSFENHKYPLIRKKPEDIQIGSNVSEQEYTQDFVPTSGWRILYRSKGKRDEHS